MKKLYAGIAATALAATGIACGAGAAHATGTWPDQFTASQIVSTTNGAAFMVGSYDTGQQEDDGDGGTYDVQGSALVEVRNGVVSTVDLGDGASPNALTAHDGTVFVVGSDADGDATLWTVAADGTLGATAALPDTGEPQEVAVSADGDRVAVAGWDNVVVMDSHLTPTATMSTSQDDDGATTGISSFGGIAFSPDGATLQIAATDDDGTVDLWSLGSAAGPTTFADVPSRLLEAADGNSYASGIAVAADGTTYVTTINGDSGLYAVKATGTPAFQALSFAQDVALSADGSTAYVAGDSGVFAVATDKLGTYGDNPNPDYFAGGDESVNAVTLDDDGDVVIAESRYDYDDETETSTTSDQVVDVVSAPGAPSQVTATRGQTYAEVSFSPASSSGSSAWTSTDPDDDTSITYTVTLTDTTHPANSPIVRSDIAATDDLWIGDDQDAGQAPLVPGDAYAITVTATNGLFTSDAATGTLAAYSSTGGGQQPVQTGPIQQPVQTQPAQVSGVKAGTMKSGSKKLKLTLGGVTTVPGKVKVYDGKKLLGTATVKNGKLVLKLKKKLAKGKHKVTVKYAGSSSVAKFTKKTKIKVT